MAADIRISVEGAAKVDARYSPPRTLKLNHGPDLALTATVAVEILIGEERLTLWGPPSEVLAALTAAVSAVVAAVPGDIQ